LYLWKSLSACLRNYSLFLITSTPQCYLVTERFVNIISVNIESEGATVKSMSSREVEEGTQWNSPCPRREWFNYLSRRRHGEREGV